MIYKLSNNKVKSINESKSIKEDINDSDEVLTFKRDVNLAKDADEIQLLIYELSDGVAEDNVQQAFNENESNDLETLKSAVITAIDVYLEDNEWLSESKSIKESSLVDKKVSTLGKRGKPMYFTAAQLKDAKAKYPEYDFEEATIDKSLPQGQKAYIAKKKTNESKSIKEVIKVGDKVKVSTPGNDFYDGRTGVVDYVKNDIVTVTFDDKKSPKLNNFDLNQVSKITKSGSTKESYYSYESARPNTREFLDLMDRYSLDTDDILRYLISDYWSDNEVGDFLDAIKVEYDLDESLKNLDEELSDAAKSAEIILRNKFLNEPYTDSDFRKYAFDYMHKKGISSDEQYKVINHVMSSEDDKMVDLFVDLK